MSGRKDGIVGWIGMVMCIGLAGCQRELPIVDDDADAGVAATPAATVSRVLRHTRPASVLDEPVEFYRIDLARSDGQVRLDAVTRITSAVRPVPALSPEYLLVGFRAGQAVDAVPVRFPTTVHDLEFDPGGGGHYETAITDSRVSVVIEADPAIDRIELIAAGNRSVLQLTAADLPKRASGGGSGGGTQDPESELRAHFPEIRFLRASEDKLLSTEVSHGGTVVDLTPPHVYALEHVLEALEPAVRSTIQTIAIVKFPWDAVNPRTGRLKRGSTIGSQIAISDAVTLADDLMATIAHEAAHSLAHATRVAAGQTDNSVQAFRPEQLAFAQNLMEEHHLLRGVDEAWRQLHESGFPLKLSSAYSPVIADESNWQAALQGGFFSTYGSSSPGEDFAEYVRDRTLGTDGYMPCTEFDGASGEMLDLAIPYAKLVLLLGIGAISENSFIDCVGPLYSVIPNAPGFTFAGRPGRLAENLWVQFRDDHMPPNYVVQASGLGYRINVNLRRREINDSPIGLHKFESIALANVDDIQHADFVSVLGQKPENARASSQGFALIVEANPDSAQGVIFGLGLQDARGNMTDSFALVSFRVD